MLKVFILVVVTSFSSGYKGGNGHRQTVSFQEFTSQKSCEANAKFLKQYRDVDEAYCTEK